MKLHVASLVSALAVLAIAGAGCRHSAAATGGSEYRVAYSPVARMLASVPIAERGSGMLPLEAEPCGTLRRGVRATFGGHVSAAGSDTFDGFAFAVPLACTLQYRLRASLPGTDLDLCAVDAATGRVLAVCNGEGEEEAGSLSIEGSTTSIDLVVSSAWGASAYTLELEVIEPGLASSAAVACPHKHTIEKLEAYLAPTRETSVFEEPSAVAGVRCELAWLAERDRSAERVVGQGLEARPRPH